jgi:hypothetical protein
MIIVTARPITTPLSLQSRQFATQQEVVDAAVRRDQTPFSSNPSLPSLLLLSLLER